MGVCLGQYGSRQLTSYSCMYVEVLSICISYYKELSLKYISYILSICLLPECFLTQSCQSYEAAALYY